MPTSDIHTLDLCFSGIPGTIASYLIPHTKGAVLVECGPSSTLPALIDGLKAHGFRPTDITDVLVTHIHLDHAGAAGWFARQGAHIHVHPAGAPHLRDPEKLLSSARRIYGDMMDCLWGEFLPVPPEQLSIPENGGGFEIEGLYFQSIDTPGHADHHYVYIFEDVCFSGDIAGVRLSGYKHTRLPMPPPDLHLAKWRLSLKRLFDLPIQRIAPTHFGIFPDAAWHLVEAAKALDEVEAWIEATLPTDPPIEVLNKQFIEWSRNRSLEEGIQQEVIDEYETVNPSWMSSNGIQRYWRKFRNVNRIPT
jgi:glyoxylase-like metal-dependent hydrolase (beta-lactamase superfamily II)